MEAQFKKLTIAPLLLLMALLACDGGGSQFLGLPWPVQLTVELEELNAAPEILSYEDGLYVLEAYVWRDYMPVPIRKERPLHAWVEVTETGGAPVSADLTAIRFWAINGTEIWESGFVHEERLEDRLQLQASGGPKWEAGTEVDVVLGFAGPDNELLLLRVGNQPIHRAD